VTFQYHCLAEAFCSHLVHPWWCLWCISSDFLSYCAGLSAYVRRSARLSSQSQCLYFPLLLLTTGISCTGGLVCLHLKYSAEISWSRAMEDIHTHAPLWQWALSMPSCGRTFQHEAELRAGVLVDSFECTFCFWQVQDGCLTLALILDRLLIIWCTVLVNLKSFSTLLRIMSTWIDSIFIS